MIFRILSFCFLIIAFFTSYIMLCIITDNKMSTKKKVYYLCKIETIKNIIKTNHQAKLFYNFDSSGNINYLSINYRKLLKLLSEEGKCIEGYKQCGIMDTLGHILCIDIIFDCPINNLTIDLISKNNSYINNNFEEIALNNLTYNYHLYSSNKFTNSNIIVTLRKEGTNPKYITMNNFYLDSNAYIDEYGPIGSYGINIEERFNNPNQTYDFQLSKSILDIFEVKGLGKIFATLFGISSYFSNNNYEEFMSYIEEQLREEKNNDDIYYQYIGEEIYIKNYIGFRSIEDIDLFINFDFNIYKDLFPTRAAYIMACVFLALQHLFVFFAYTIFDNLKNIPGRKKNKNDEKIALDDSQVDKALNQQLPQTEEVENKEKENKEKEEKKENKEKNEEKKEKEEKESFEDKIKECFKSICTKSVLICTFYCLNIFFLGWNIAFLIYCCVKYVDVYKNNKVYILKRIVSDEFVTNFINEFIPKFDDDGLIIKTIIVISVSIGFELASIILRCISKLELLPD